MEMMSEQLDDLYQLEKWVNDARLNFRKDSDFLKLFLRSTNFNVDQAKKTMRLYYQNRVDYSQWWTERDMNFPILKQILNTNILTVLIDGDAKYPTIGISRLEEFGTDSNRLDDIGKVFTLSVEIGLRRLNCQLNGGIYILDFKNCPSWLVMDFLWPPRSVGMIKAFVWALPLKITSMVFVNCNRMCLPAIKMFKFFTPAWLKHRIHCFDSDWSKLGEVVPLKLLPEEYGGSAGPIQQHQDAFFEEVMSLNEYFLDDETKYNGMS